MTSSMGSKLYLPFFKQKKTIRISFKKQVFNSFSHTVLLTSVYANLSTSLSYGGNCCPTQHGKCGIKDNEKPVRWL